MAGRTRVVLYGRSLYMAGLAVSLQADPALDVVHICSDGAGIEQVLQAAPTAAVVFEIDALPRDLVIDYMSTYPGLLVIGMDLASENILLLSGQHVCVGTMTDMIGLLTGALPGAHQAAPLIAPELDAPEVSILLSPAEPDGDDGWYRSPVMVQPQASDASPVVEVRCALDPAEPPASFDDLPHEPCPFLAGALVDTNGEHIFYAAAMDVWGNKSDVVSVALRIDITERVRALLPFAQTLPSAPPAAPPDPSARGSE